jgi:hypothetical protein
MLLIYSRVTNIKIETKEKKLFKKTLNSNFCSLTFLLQSAELTPKKISLKWMVIF